MLHSESATCWDTDCIRVCACVCMGTLHSYCVWLMHRDTLTIKSEEINIPFSFISVISSFALSHFLNPWLPCLVFCRHSETLRHVVAFGRSFTIKFARQKNTETEGRERESLSMTLLHKQARIFPPCLRVSSSLFTVMALKWNTVLLFTLSIRIESHPRFHLRDL